MTTSKQNPSGTVYKQIFASIGKTHRNRIAGLFLFLLAITTISSVGVAEGKEIIGTDNSAPAIDVWYDLQQKFGHIGNPQRWVNILGNVSDPDGLASLSYSLNGEPEVDLSIGPDGRRLAKRGDFNIDIDRDNLSAGNQVVITATDSLGSQATETVTITFTAGKVWPINYFIDWSQVYSDPAKDIQDVAEVVDGLWSVNANGLRTQIIGYDRLVAIGDRTWSDYEVTVPITIHSVDHSASQPGVGLLLRWQGHTDDPISGWQPKTGWKPFGAIGWWRFYSPTDVKLEFHDTGVNQNFNPSLNTKYWFKMRVETLSNQHRYRLKVWEFNNSEPSSWNLELFENAAGDLETGSFMLISHHVDVTYGDVSVIPIGNTYSLTVTEVGGGSVMLNPPGGTYGENTEVTLTPQPNSGWTFQGWSGADAGELTDNGDGTWSIIMDSNKSVTATFVEQYTLSVTTIGSGNVEKNPDSPDNKYAAGTSITLTPVAGDGWAFGSWGGPNAGDLVPNGDGTWTITMVNDMSVTANFVQEEYTISWSAIGEGSVEIFPDGPYLYGDVVTLTATPDPAWEFDYWAGDLNGNENPIVHTVKGDVSITATFTQYHVLLPVVALP